MKLAFLGTGAAFSRERYNGAVVVDGRVLLDAGAPVLPHMHRLGINPDAIEAIFVTHFHGDHTLGLPPFMLHRAMVSRGGRLTVVGPAGVEDRLEHLFETAWGPDWAEAKVNLDLRYEEAVEGRAGNVGDIEYQPVRLDHGRSGGTGYLLRMGGRSLAYAGDSEATPPLDRLVEGAEVAIVEATGPGEVAVHTSWEQAQELAARHPRTRFIFNHVYSGALPGAASDLEVVEA